MQSGKSRVPGPPLTQPLILDFCWICGSDRKLHQHHIVPRAYGGEKGPTITVCGSCHSSVHAVGEEQDYWTTVGNQESLRLTDLASVDSGWSVDKIGTDAEERITYLVTLIRRSKVMTSAVSKPLHLQTKLPREYRDKVALLKKSMNCSNIPQVIAACIDEAYAKRFR